MSRPGSPQERTSGRQARWARALADERSEAASGALGPCHGLGGAGHRCDSPARWRTVSFNGKPSEPYRWCDAEVDGVKRAAASHGETVVIEDGLRCPDCGGAPCHDGRELVPVYGRNPRTGAMVLMPSAGDDICENDCHDHDRPQEDDDA